MTAIDRLNQIEAIANAATEGPWSWACRTSAAGDHWDVFKGDTAHALASNRDGWGPDAEFIAAARTDVPWLIEQVRKRDNALRAVLDLIDSRGKQAAEALPPSLAALAVPSYQFNVRASDVIRAIGEAFS